MLIPMGGKTQEIMLKLMQGLDIPTMTTLLLANISINYTLRPLGYRMNNACQLQT